MNGPFARFRRLTQQVIAAPKKEVEKKLAERKSKRPRREK